MDETYINDQYIEDKNLPKNRKQFLKILEEMRGHGWDHPAFDRYSHDAARAFANEWADELENCVFGKPVINGDTSDGYHTFNDLYHHRAILFSVIVSQFRNLAWKSKLHNDGTMYDGMFLVGIDTPAGQATYHFDVDPYWDKFDCQELERAPEWDGHTPDDAIERIESLKDI